MRHKVTICLSLLLVSSVLTGCKTLEQAIAEERAERQAAADIAYAKAIAAQAQNMTPEEREALKVAQQRRLQGSSNDATNAALINQGAQLLQGQQQAPTTRLQTTCVRQGVHLICN